MTKRFLIIGNGFIGKYLRDFYINRYEETVMSSRQLLDLEDGQSIKNFFISQKSFTHIIYAAGIKNVRLCQEQPKRCLSVNTDAISSIRYWATGSPKFVYLSTDYVFEGSQGNYTEKSQPNPQTAYGKTKFLGERLTIENFPHSLIVRTGGVYGEKCPWFTWLLTELVNGKKVDCFTDIINSPTEIGNLAEMINECLEKNIAGTMNLCGPVSMNRYDLYNLFCELKGYSAYKSLLQKSTTNSPLFPKNISLDNKLYQSLFLKNSIHPNIGLSI